MKLILKEYLASLRERDELDAVLPDLLSQMGLTVFSRPGRGTRQDGVDIGAVGSLDAGRQKVFLFAIKPGDITRLAWDGDAIQSLRPTLNEILDAYIPNRLPAEHKEKDVAICICCGGDVLEQVRAQLEGFKKQHTTTKITFEEWNGDKLAELIQAHFLREDLLPPAARNRLRKALALLDEPEASYAHFSNLVASLSKADTASEREILRRIRQIALCVWILFAWAREGGNIEAAYRSAELALLHAWAIARPYAKSSNKTAEAIQAAFGSILGVYQQICLRFLEKCILPHVDVLHGISSAVRGSHSLDINLKLFDVLGRLGTMGLWARWTADQCSPEQAAVREKMLGDVRGTCHVLRQMIENNPVLLLPAKDEQAIDVMISLTLLTLDRDHRAFIETWLSEMLGRAVFAYQTHGAYPCNIDRYSELLERGDSDERRKEITSGSILYPAIALWAALLQLDELYGQVAMFKKEHLEHCNFQFWYPDEESEKHLYLDTDGHGAVLSHIPVDRPQSEFIVQVLAECESSASFNTLSAVEAGLWPLVVVACRHYRLPLPIHLVKRLCLPQGKESDPAGAAAPATQ